MGGRLSTGALTDGPQSHKFQTLPRQLQCTPPSAPGAQGEWRPTQFWVSAMKITTVPPATTPHFGRQKTPSPPDATWVSLPGPAAVGRMPGLGRRPRASQGEYPGADIQSSTTAVALGSGPGPVASLLFPIILLQASFTAPWL